MFLVIYEPSTDVTLVCRRMAPNETLDARLHADRLANSYDRQIADPSGHIPSSCGDIRVEFRPRKNDGVVIWAGQSFYFAE